MLAKSEHFYFKLQICIWGNNSTGTSRAISSLVRADHLHMVSK